MVLLAAQRPRYDGICRYSLALRVGGRVFTCGCTVAIIRGRFFFLLAVLLLFLRDGFLLLAVLALLLRNGFSLWAVHRVVGTYSHGNIELWVHKAIGT